MTDIASAIKKIQVEAVDRDSAVSEGMLRDLGASNNGLIDQQAIDTVAIAANSSRINAVAEMGYGLNTTVNYTGNSNTLIYTAPAKAISQIEQIGVTSVVSGGTNYRLTIYTPIIGLMVFDVNNNGAVIDYTNLIADKFGLILLPGMTIFMQNYGSINLNHTVTYKIRTMTFPAIV